MLQVATDLLLSWILGSHRSSCPVQRSDLEKEKSFSLELPGQLITLSERPSGIFHHYLETKIMQTGPQFNIVLGKCIVILL